jgi:hypothetical protein
LICPLAKKGIPSKNSSSIRITIILALTGKDN